MSIVKEGGVGKPTRLAIEWQRDDFYDTEQVEQEMERVFDICHGCRRCFNLCDAFPTLFDLLDGSATGELDAVPKADYHKVVDACTLCDMCYMTKCPYVPPHPFNIDFPNLMVRHRAAQLHHESLATTSITREEKEKEENKKKGYHTKIQARSQSQLAYIDRNHNVLSPIAPIVNWANDSTNQVTRYVLDKVAGIHPKVNLPPVHRQSVMEELAYKARKRDHLLLPTDPAIKPNPHGPSFGTEVALLINCYPNYHGPSIAKAALDILAHNGIAARPVYPSCCGMPLWEQGKISEVAHIALAITEELWPLVEAGLPILSIVPSCTFMIKHLWPLLHPDNPKIRGLSQAVNDTCDYIVNLGKTVGLTPGLQPIPGGISVHLACHDRAQNIGPKAAQMLRLIPNTEVSVIERCSGHGGSWGITTAHFDQAKKVGGPAAAMIQKQNKSHVTSSCPLAAKHLFQLNAENKKKVNQVGKDGLSTPSNLSANFQETIVKRCCGGGCKEKNDQGEKGKDQAEEHLSNVGKDLPLQKTFPHPLELLAMAYGKGITASQTPRGDE